MLVKRQKRECCDWSKQNIEKAATPFHLGHSFQRPWKYNSHMTVPNPISQRFEQGTQTDLVTFLKQAVPHLPTRMFLSGPAWGPEACRLIADASPTLDLRVLFLRGTFVADRGVETLADAPVLATVYTLAIERCGLTDVGVAALARSAWLTGLRELYLCNRGGVKDGLMNEIGNAGMLALAASASLGQLQTLDLSNTNVGDEGLAALVTSPHLPRLGRVITWGTQLTATGAQRIKALALESWERRRRVDAGAIHCYVHTDYDERYISYNEGE